MSFNGSGTFVINSTGQPVVTGTVISSSTFNAFTADIGTGLSTAITKNGQTTTTALIPFAFGISAAVSSSFAAGTVAAPSIYLATDTGTGFYRIGANNNGYSVSGTKLLDFSSALLAVTGAGTFSTTLGVTGASSLGGSTSQVIINRTTDGTSYGSISFNGLLASTTMSGIFGRGGAGGDVGSMYYAAVAGQKHFLQVNAATVATVDVNGINGILGGTTPAAASVTTLTASSTIAYGTGTTTTVGLRFNSGFTNYASIYPENVTPGATNYTLISKYDSTLVYLNSLNTVALTIGATPIVQATSIGATVAGTLGVTGITTLSAIVNSTVASGSNLDLNRTGSQSAIDFRTSGTLAGQIAAGSSAGFQFYDHVGAAVIGLWSASGGLAITGKLSATGVVTFSNYGVGTATFNGSGVISSVSDETWKIKDGIPTDSDSMLKKLEPGYWYYNDEKKETFGKDRQLGFYAQNVNAAIGPEAAPEPETVTIKNEDGTETSFTKPWGYYDRSVLAVVVMSLQKALLAVEQLTAKVAALETK
jgi:hypothetical protein